MRRYLAVALVAVVVAVSCGSNDGGGAGSTSTRTGPAQSSSSSTKTASTSTVPTCTPAGGTGEVRDAFPDRMSALTGRDVRTGKHPCFERFVIEFGPDDATGPFPGYFVRYTSPPVKLSPSDLPVTIRGDAVLLVSLGSWMKGPEPGGYTGPDDVIPTNVEWIRQYRIIEDFEGLSTWAIGLDRTRPFTVTKLAGPHRLVVDIHAG